MTRWPLSTVSRSTGSTGPFATAIASTWSCSPPVRSVNLENPDQGRRRGNRVNGKVLPVENRHFNHWNTDPWELDYGGNGGELAAGTVYLLPYYMGLYHGFIQKPGA